MSHSSDKTFNACRSFRKHIDILFNQRKHIYNRLNTLLELYLSISGRYTTSTHESANNGSTSTCHTFFVKFFLNLCSTHISISKCINRWLYSSCTSLRVHIIEDSIRKVSYLKLSTRLDISSL